MSWENAVTVLVPHRSGNVEILVARADALEDGRPMLKARGVVYQVDFYDHEPTNEDIVALARSLAEKLP